MIPDPMKAVRTLLLGDADVASFVGAKVFAGELPEAEQGDAHACIVIREAGGGAFGMAWQDYGDLRVDVFAYGATSREASAVSRAVHRRMKTLQRNVSETVLVHWALKDGGPLPLTDPLTAWRYVFSSWQVLVSEVAAA